MKLNSRTRDTIQGWGFLSPTLIIVMIFTVISVLFALYISFHNVNLFKGTFEFVGLDNYARLFTDTKVRIALWNTMSYVFFVVPIQTFLALVMASVLNAKIKGQLFFRTVFFLPTLTSSAALTMIFMFLFSINGPINMYALQIGLLSEKINFLNNPDFALKVIMAMNIWSTVPFFMTIYLAALQEIPNSIYEAAEVDGANAYQKFFKITIPYLKPITTFVILMGIIGCFQLFDQAFIFSNGSGGPENSTLTMALLIWRNAFGQNNTMGFATAIAIVLAVIIFITSLIANKLNKSDSLY